MTPQETLLLARYVKACCPQQTIDEYTPETWHDLLGDLSLADCRQAVVEVAKRQPFVAPSEIREEVRRVRRQRVEDAEVPAPPHDLADNPAAYQAALHAARVAIADGADPEQAIALVAKRARRELGAS